MTTSFLTLRLAEQDALLIERYQSQTGLSKTEIVKRALHKLLQEDPAPAQTGLFALGQSKFGRFGDATRQAADIKQVVRAQLAAKRGRVIQYPC